MSPRQTIPLLAATLLALLSSGPHRQANARRGTQPLGFVFYDVDRLYDTIPSPFYDDSQYTPQGRRKWNTERYRRKIGHTAAVIDSMALPIVALYGVENEQVVRDLAATCREEYSYLHRTLNSLDGLDFALLYYGDRFFPHRAEPGHRYLYVEGTIGSDTLGILLCRDRRMAQWVVGELREEDPRRKLLVAGSLDPGDLKRWNLRDATARAERAGRGSALAHGRWVMRDRIFVDQRFGLAEGDVYARRWLVDPETGRPIPTFDRLRYCGGYGEVLPLFAYIR